MIKRFIIFIFFIIILIISINDYYLFDFLYTLNNYCYNDYNIVEIKYRHISFFIKRFFKDLYEEGAAEADDFAKIGYGIKREEDDIDEESIDILDADYILPKNMEPYEKSFHSLELFLISLVVMFTLTQANEWNKIVGRY